MKRMNRVKCILIRRKPLAILGCAILAVAMLLVVNHPVFVGASATTRQLPIYCVQKDYPVCSLSFDAAWADVRMRPLILLGLEYQWPHF